MTAHREPRPARRTPRGPVRRVAALTLATALVLVASALPAQADVPLGWDPERQPVDNLHILWIVLGIVGGILLIVAACYLPAVARGEDVRPGGARAVEAEWFGGPRKGHDELAAPDDAESQAGGASGRW
ncbi:MAG TPA: hypothetical protein VGE77_13885 [Nocardioides sp.]